MHPMKAIAQLLGDAEKVLAAADQEVNITARTLAEDLNSGTLQFAEYLKKAIALSTVSGAIVSTRGALGLAHSLATSGL